jgi:uncharacterized membrane protein YciS (DUF1049 family)
MIVIIGFIVLLFAIVVGVLGVLNNAGAVHPLNESFSVLGYHVTGSTGTLFLFGMVVGALAMLGLSVLLAGARRSAGRGRDARRELKRAQREVNFVNRDREFQNQSADAATGTVMDLSRPRPDEEDERFHPRSPVVVSAPGGIARRTDPR